MAARGSCGGGCRRCMHAAHCRSRHHAAHCWRRLPDPAHRRSRGVENTHRRAGTLESRHRCARHGAPIAHCRAHRVFPRKGAKARLPSDEAGGAGVRQEDGIRAHHPAPKHRVGGNRVVDDGGRTSGAEAQSVRSRSLHAELAAQRVSEAGKSGSRTAAAKNPMKEGPMWRGMEFCRSLSGRLPHENDLGRDGVERRRSLHREVRRPGAGTSESGRSSRNNSSGSCRGQWLRNAPYDAGPKIFLHRRA